MEQIDGFKVACVVTVVLEHRPEREFCSLYFPI